MHQKLKFILLCLAFAGAVGVAYYAGLASRDSESQSPSQHRAEKSRQAETKATTPSAYPHQATKDSSMKTADGFADRPGESMPVPDAPQDAAASDDSSGRFRPDPYVLRQRFPQNQALPPVTREELEAKQAERERRNREYGKIAANKASRQEIEAYYEEQTRLAEDSIQILVFMLTEYLDEMDETQRKRNEFLLESFENRLALISEKKAAALRRLESK